MTVTPPADPSRLAELRAMIDAIDESVHRLLMQRATVIDELIQVKGTSRNGAAFRPGREADMMRRLVQRHEGHLPLVAIEHLWREIISTFTALQAPFDVAVSLTQDPVSAIETARFYFGFSVPLIALPDASAVVNQLEQGGDRLGVVFLDEGHEPWWTSMETCRIMARLPYLQARTRSAARPALVLAPPLSDPVPFEVTCFTLEAKDIDVRKAEGVEILGKAQNSYLVASASKEEGILAAAESPIDIRFVGGYAAPLQVSA